MNNEHLQIKMSLAVSLKPNDEESFDVMKKIYEWVIAESKIVPVSAIIKQ